MDWLLPTTFFFLLQSGDSQCYYLAGPGDGEDGATLEPCQQWNYSQAVYQVRHTWYHPTRHSTPKLSNFSTCKCNKFDEKKIVTFMWHSDDTFHYVFKAEFVTLAVSLKVPMGTQPTDRHVPCLPIYMPVEHGCGALRPGLLSLPPAPPGAVALLRRRPHRLAGLRAALGRRWTPRRLPSLTGRVWHGQRGGPAGSHLRRMGGCQGRRRRLHHGRQPGLQRLQDGGRAIFQLWTRSFLFHKVEGAQFEKILQFTLILPLVCKFDYPTNIASVNLVMGCSKDIFFTILTPALGVPTAMSVI